MCGSDINGMQYHIFLDGKDCCDDCTITFERIKATVELQVELNPPGLAEVAAMVNASTACASVTLDTWLRMTSDDSSQSFINGSIIPEDELNGGDDLVKALSVGPCSVNSCSTWVNIDTSGEINLKADPSTFGGFGSWRAGASGWIRNTAVSFTWNARTACGLVGEAGVDVY